MGEHLAIKPSKAPHNQLPVGVIVHPVDDQLPKSYGLSMLYNPTRDPKGTLHEADLFSIQLFFVVDEGKEESHPSDMVLRVKFNPKTVAPLWEFLTRE